MKKNNEILVDKKAKALIFDLDGTLADTMELHYHAWNEIMKQYGYEYPRDLLNKLAGMPSDKIIPIINSKFNIELEPKKTIRLKEELFLNKIDSVRPIEKIVNIVYQYYKRLPMALGTGGRKRIVLLTLEVLNLKEYFDAIVSAEDVTEHKPHPETFLKCAKIMNVAPQYCQVFEDGEQGLIAAKNAGMIVTDVRKFLN